MSVIPVLRDFQNSNYSYTGYKNNLVEFWWPIVNYTIILSCKLRLVNEKLAHLYRISYKHKCFVRSMFFGYTPVGYSRLGCTPCRDTGTSIRSFGYILVQVRFEVKVYCWDKSWLFFASRDVVVVAHLGLRKWMSYIPKYLFHWVVTIFASQLRRPGEKLIIPQLLKAAFAKNVFIITVRVFHAETIFSSAFHIPV